MSKDADRTLNKLDKISELYERARYGTDAPTWERRCRCL
jgi:hypothetical protein